MNATREDLPSGELSLEGLITTASNATFAARIGEVRVVYKPVAGERPLWDFPDGTLAMREVAAYAVSEAFGWDLVPPTWLRDGPLGSGMVQLWRDPDRAHPAVAVVPAGEVPDGWRHVLDGLDADENVVSVVHEDSPVLRRMAVLDVVTNNADRKGGHVLEMPDGHRHGIDHGLTFHTEHKLRTVLWGWAGQELCPEELDGVERVRSALEGDLGEALAELLDDDEIIELGVRCERLLEARRFPAPRGEMPAIPWPPF
ncbi:SCO1664 family protein [Georgenia alba]|uniref:SCO1664 family protein n=1 Tax=Georgenia alba TaxID=2233858 RepID=A0ABW2QAU1_9MICO